MKKSISWILSAILLSFQIPAIAEESQEILQESAEVNQEEQVNKYERYSEYVEFVNILGIMPEEAFEGNLYMTRGEFADYVNNILFSGDGNAEVQAWVSEVFREDKIDELIIPSIVTDTFTDVSRSHTYYNEIERVKQFFVMNGTGNDTFSPDERITFGEVGTAMVRLLGYSMRAKLTSYEGTALELGVFDGLSYNKNNNITTYELAKVFYNCSDINLMKADINMGKAEYGISDENILENYMNIYKDKGQVISNSFTSVYAKDGAGKNKAAINDVVYNIENTEYLNDYIGREVEYYYFDDGDVDYPQILIAKTTNKDETVTIQAEDVVEFENYRFVYETKQRTVSKKIKEGAALIYNDVYMSNYTPEMFKFENGDITLIKSKKSSEFDIIIVNNYTSFYIAEINNENGILFGKTSDNSDVRSFNTLTGTADEYKVRFYWQDGNKASINDISRGMICDVAQNDVYMKIIIPMENVYTVTINSIGEQNGRVSIEDTEGKSFEFLQSYYDVTEHKKPMLKGSYVLYLNSFGRIVWIEIAKDEKSSKIHYLIRAADDEEGNGGYIRLLNSKGVIAMYHVITGAKIKNQDNETIKLKSGASLSGIFDGYSGIVDVDITESNEVTRIEMPQKSTTVERSGRLGVFEENEKAYWCGQGNEKHFENAMLSQKVVLFKVDTSEIEEQDKYKVVNQNILKSGNTYSIKAYNYNSESIVSDCIVFSGALLRNIDDNNKTMYIVESISDVLNDEDEPVVRIECKGISASAKLTDEKMILKSGMGAYAETFFDADANIALKKGDIIYCETENDYVTRIVLVYRVFNEEGESNLHGTTGAYTPNISNATNPYAVGNVRTIETNVNTVTKLRPALTRFFSGYVYRLEDDKYLTYTSMPLSVGTKFDRKNLDSKYLAETIVMPKNYVVLNVYDNRIEVKEGDISGIKTFCNSGSARSEVFVTTRYGVAWQLVFINRH